jgi:hypothetical protein
MTSYCCKISAPFSFFLIWLSTGDWLLPCGERWGRELSKVSFWFWGSRSDTLFLVLVYEKSWVRSAGQCRGLQPPIRATQMPGDVVELKPGWFWGILKFCLGFFSDILGAWLAGIFLIHLLCRCWDQTDGGRGCFLPYVGLLNLCGVKLYVLVCKSS